MNLQEIYDRVVQHLHRQGHRAVVVGTGSRCVYLAPDGSRCAVGALIPDGHPALRPGFGVGVEDLLEEYPDLGELIAPTWDHVDLLYNLQTAHDDPTSWADSGLSESGWEQLRSVAWLFNLDDSVARALQGEAHAV